jgi:hypothetical protein
LLDSLLQEIAPGCGLLLILSETKQPNNKL